MTEYPHPCQPPMFFNATPVLRDPLADKLFVRVVGRPSEGYCQHDISCGEWYQNKIQIGQLNTLWQRCYVDNGGKEPPLYVVMGPDAFQQFVDAIVKLEQHRQLLNVQERLREIFGDAHKRHFKTDYAWPAAIIYWSIEWASKKKQRGCKHEWMPTGIFSPHKISYCVKCLARTTEEVSYGK